MATKDRPNDSAYAAGRVSEMRAALGLTLVEFADLCGISLATIYRWERDGVSHKVHSRTLWMIEQAAARSPAERAALAHELRTSGALMALHRITSWVLRSPGAATP